MTFEEFLVLPVVIEAQSYRDKTRMEVEWKTGGVTGGSCWSSNSHHYPVAGDPEPEFEDLDKVLEGVCPKISFLQYKGICREVIELSDRRQNDYYGNHTEYALKIVTFEKLYWALVEREIL